MGPGLYACMGVHTCTQTQIRPRPAGRLSMRKLLRWCDLGLSGTCVLDHAQHAQQRAGGRLRVVTKWCVDAEHAVIATDIHAKRINANQQWGGGLDVSFLHEQRGECISMLTIHHGAQLRLGVCQRIGHHQGFAINRAAMEPSEVEIEHRPSHIVRFAVIDAPTVSKAAIGAIRVKLVQLHEQLQTIWVFIRDMQGCIKRGEHRHHGWRDKATIRRDHIAHGPHVLIEAQHALRPGAKHASSGVENGGVVVHGAKQ